MYKIIARRESQLTILNCVFYRRAILEARLWFLMKGEKEGKEGENKLGDYIFFLVCDPDLGEVVSKNPVASLRQRGIGRLSAC